MIDRTPLLEKFSFGFVIGFIFALLIAALFDSDVAEGIKNNFVNLAAIAAAIIAAYFALLGIRRQIEQQYEQSESARLASLAATKAFLPIVLSEMCRIAEAGMRHRWSFSSTVNGASSGSQVGDFQRTSTSDLALSDQVISVFRDFIKNANSNDGKRVAIILREYQVLFSRWNGLFENPSSTEDTADTVHETTYWAYLYALSSSVFGFARGEASTIDTTVDASDIRGPLAFRFFYRQNPSEFDTQIDLYQRKFRREN